MELKIKKIIAKEALIIIGLIIIALAIRWLTGQYLPSPKTDPQAYKLSSFSNYELYKMVKARGMECSMPAANTYFTPANINRVLHFIIAPLIIILGYPLTIFLRFIAWAIKTLKQG